jgi:hypothetical protein
VRLGAGEIVNGEVEVALLLPWLTLLLGVLNPDRGRGPIGGDRVTLQQRWGSAGDVPALKLSTFPGSACALRARRAVLRSGVFREGGGGDGEFREGSGKMGSLRMYEASCVV